MKINIFYVKKTLIFVLDLGVLRKARVQNVNAAERGCLVQAAFHERYGHNAIAH
jgi:hypothetical protein